MSELDKIFGGNPVKEINQICDKMIAFAHGAGTVVDCGVCNNKGCIVCDDIDYDTLANEYNQQQSYESGRVFH